MANTRRAMTRAAAVFDLDRTLLAGGSGPAIQRALRAAGVIPDRDLPLVEDLFRVFAVVGENLPTMLLTRRAARAARGWRVDAVAEAGRLAADELERLVLPLALAVAEEHRRAGRALVLATTTPAPFVEPLAERLGFDAAVGTRYGTDGDHYDGTVDGPFVWHRGKLAAVRAWAATAGVDLESGHAYSDSWFDAPLLASVAHPTAVNPDPRLATLAALRGWPIRWFDVPPGAVKIAGVELQALIRPFVRPQAFPAVDFSLVDLDEIPAKGPAILAANHRSYFDVAAIAVAAARRGRTVRFLAKAELFGRPVVGDVLRALGGIPVERGSGSDRPIEDAAGALACGELVCTFPQGTIPRGRDFFEPQLSARPGSVRLARRTGAPIVPVGLWGTEAVWPRSSRLPPARIGRRLPVTVRAGPPLAVSPHVDEVDEMCRVMDAIVDLLPPEARRAREPTDSELAATYPPGAAR